MTAEQSDAATSRMKIGVVLPITEDEATGQTSSYHEIRSLALQAEDAGFDSLWIIDHLLFRFPDKPTAGVWEGWTLLTALAEATDRVELGTLVLCTAFRNPALLAKMAATVEEISGGRLILGLGAGWHEPEFDAFGLPFDHRVDRFEEALQIIIPLLRTGQVDFRGRYYQAPNCELRPRGPRPDGPPILVGAGRPRMLQLTARYADSWNTCWLGQPAALAERRANLEAACGAVGRDPQTLAETVGVSLTYAAPGETTPTIDPAKSLIGSPDEIAAAFAGYADLGVAHLMCALDPFNTESLRWLAEAVDRWRTQTA